MASLVARLGGQQQHRNAALPSVTPDDSLGRGQIHHNDTKYTRYLGRGRAAQFAAWDQIQYTPGTRLPRVGGTPTRGEEEQSAAHHPHNDKLSQSRAIHKLCRNSLSISDAAAPPPHGEVPQVRRLRTGVGGGGVYIVTEELSSNHYYGVVTTTTNYR